ncbi:ATP synthase F1 subunit gamma [Spiroplasma endosymbiont of Aspidapion aeneum]|uniref:ATP synthase F1 subunit gamma n=1 Tax=Spiroplasma endosymbiont of Aspidapion aeneum TaxID=3066276 RepID=UPI00313D1614
MANLSNLKSDIQDVKEILKITGAMELVATAKLKKIGKKTVNISKYVEKVYEVFIEIISNADRSPYLGSAERHIDKTLWVIVGSNLGMCGSYNSGTHKKLSQNIKENDLIYAIGSKVVSYCNSNKYKIWDSYLNLDVDFTSDMSKPIANKLLEGYLNNDFQSIKIIYQHFINNMTTEPKITNVFPIAKSKKESQGGNMIYEFEPSADEILNSTVSLYLNTLIYGAFIEGQLSEFSSRRNAMESANKNGDEINEKLSLEYNRKRQEKITQEITEIVAGTNAQG